MTLSSQQAVAVAPETTIRPELTRRHKVTDLGLIILIAFGPLVVSAIYAFLVPLKGDPGYTNFRFATGLVHEVGALALLICLLQRQGRKLADIGLSFQWLDLPRGVALSLGSYAASYVFAYTAQVVYYFWNREFFHYRSSDVIFAGGSVVLFLASSIAAPMFEETLVRGYLMTELIQLSWPAWLAAIVSVLLQTGYHLYYGLGGALVLGAGFAVSATYFAVSRRLLPVILSHLIWDLTAAYVYWHR